VLLRAEVHALVELHAPAATLVLGHVHRQVGAA
jgi:hypothetical protein